MLKNVMLAALMTAPLFAAAPALAQNAAQNGVLIVYGQDKCPTNKDGEEIVVCRRLDESERYRIPKDVRTDTIDPKYDSWAVKSEANAAVGATGAGSCSTVGAGGGTGCFVQQATQAKRERKAARKEAENLPLP
jgi:hypothetical protein